MMFSRMWLYALWLHVVVVAFVASLVPWGSADARDGCLTVPPVAQVEAQNIYADPAGSVIDISALRRNQQLLQPLRAFTHTLARQVDGNAGEPMPMALRCAATMLQQWAAAGAMLRQPVSFAGVRQRQRFALGIDLATLKLRAMGGMLDGMVVRWLHALNSAVIRDFSRRGITDNLEVWSAVNAASLALIDGDRAAIRYESYVWRESLGQIRQGGFVPSEVRRKSRALLYHQYYASGLLFLRGLRIALGQSVTMKDEGDLRRLLDLVEASLCDPAVMVSASGGSRQELPPADQFAVGWVFGSDLIDERWTRCGLKPREMYDDTLGGQLERTFELVGRPKRRSAYGHRVTNVLASQSARFWTELNNGGSS